MRKRAKEEERKRKAILCNRKDTNLRIHYVSLSQIFNLLSQCPSSVRCESEYISHKAVEDRIRQSSKITKQ